MLRLSMRRRALWITGLLAAMALLSSAAVGLASDTDTSTDQVRIDIDRRSATFSYGVDEQEVSTTSSPCHVPDEQLGGPVLNMSAATYDWRGDAVPGFVGIKDSYLGVNRTGQGNSHWCKKIDYLGHGKSELLDISLGDLPAGEGKLIHTAELNLKLWTSAKVKIEFFKGDNKIGEEVTYLHRGKRTIEASPGELFDRFTLSSKWGSYSLRSSTLHLEGTVASATLDAEVDDDGYYFAPGDSVPVTYTITNNGDQVIVAYDVDDPATTGVTCPATPIESGDSVTCTGTVDISEDAEGGEYEPTAELSGFGAYEDPIGDTASYAYFVAIPGLTIDLQTSDGSVTGDEVEVPAGAPLTWIYTLVNTGNVAIEDVVVTDSGVGAEGGPGANDCPTTIEAGATVECSATGTAEESDPDTLFENSASVTGTPIAGSLDEDISDASSYFGYFASLTIEAISPNGEVVTEGDPVTYLFRITNDGNIPLIVDVTEDPDGESPADQCSGIEVPARSVDESCTFVRTAVLGDQGSTFTATGNSEVLDEVVVVVTPRPAAYVGGLACGEAAQEGDPGAVDFPFIYFANGPASTGEGSAELPNACNTPVVLSVDGPDDEGILGSADAVPAAGQEFGPATGIITVEWDAVLPSQLPLQVTKELVDAVELDIPACEGTTTVMTTPVVLTGGQVVYELASQVEYPTAVPAGRNVCEVLTIEATIINDGVQLKQLTEVFYFNNDPKFVRR